MSLTITIDRTEAGRFRAEVAEDSYLVIEHDELSKVVEELKRNLDLIAIMPDGRFLLIQSKAQDDLDDAEARSEVERNALRNEDLDELINRFPVPDEWSTEPGWSDAL